MRDSGILEICSLTTGTAGGDMPVETLHTLCTAYYSEQTVGIERLYAAKAAQDAIDMVVRLWNTPAAPDGAAYVVLEDGNQYRIVRSRKIIDEDALELTLERMEGLFDVDRETEINQIGTE